MQTESIGCIGDWTGRDGKRGCCGACAVAYTDHWEAAREVIVTVSHKRQGIYRDKCIDGVDPSKCMAKAVQAFKGTRGAYRVMVEIVGVAGPAMAWVMDIRDPR